MRAGVRSALIVALGVLVPILMGAVDPVALLVPGRRGAAGATMAADFGVARVPLRYHYDGEEYYLAARELPDVKAAGRLVAGPRYRLMRVLLPLLASVGDRGTPIVLLLLAWNIVGIGLAVAGLTDLAIRHGRSPTAGLAAVPALALPLFLSTGECLAFGLALVGLALADRHRWGWSIGALALAGLARETALVFVLGAAVAALLARRRGAALAIALLAPLPTALWWLALRRLLPGDDFSPPLQLFGFRSLGSMPATDQAVAAGVVVLAVAALIAWRRVPIVFTTVVLSIAWFAIYAPDTYDWRALPRVAAPLVAFGLAGLAIPKGTAPDPVSAE